jgi:hypothetical protein
MTGISNGPTTSARVRSNVSLGSISTKQGSPSDVRFALDSDRTADIAVGAVRAMKRHVFCGDVVASRLGRHVGRAAYLWIAKTLIAAQAWECSRHRKSVSAGPQTGFESPMLRLAVVRR